METGLGRGLEISASSRARFGLPTKDEGLEETAGIRKIEFAFFLQEHVA